MLQICVADIEAAYERCEKTPHKIKLEPIQSVPWGKVFYVWGPAGELLHMTELKHAEKTS